MSSGLADLLSVPSLKSLDLSECPHISGTEMVKGLKGSKTSRANLEMLNLKSCTYVRVCKCFFFFSTAGEKQRITRL